MVDILESEVLNDLFKVRGEKFKDKYDEYLNKTKGTRNKEQAEKEFFNFIKRTINNKELRNEFMNELYEFQKNVMQEMNWWNKEYYKLGFLDGNKIRSEIKKIKKISENKEEKYENDIVLNGFIDELINSIEDEKFKRLLKRKEYIELKKQIAEIEEEYPNVKSFIEDEELIELNKKELNQLLKVIDLERNIVVLENEEAFKIGLNVDDLF